ncbi:MAG: hypothetical protein ACRDOH_00175 [Streptosporangiaceae bacterium]
MRLQQRLVEAPGLLVVQARRVTDDKAAPGSEDDLSRLEGHQPGEGPGVDDPVAVLLARTLLARTVLATLSRTRPRI